jgi:hypothetical protein
MERQEEESELLIVLERMINQDASDAGRLI